VKIEMKISIQYDLSLHSQPSHERPNLFGVD